MNVTIEYLTETDRLTPAYRTVSTRLAQINSIRCHNTDDLIATINQVNTDQEECILTILTHGHPTGITFGTNDSLVTWESLAELIANRKTVFSLTLNLVGVCNSFLIEQFIQGTIDRAWVTTDFTDSINKSLLLLESENFQDFFDQLDESEQPRYREIL